MYWTLSIAKLPRTGESQVGESTAVSKLNLPAGKQAVLLTQDQIRFLIDNCLKNEQFAVNQLLKWSGMRRQELEAVRDSFLKLDALKNEFRELRITLEDQLGDA